MRFYFLSTAVAVMLSACSGTGTEVPRGDGGAAAATAPDGGAAPAAGPVSAADQACAAKPDADGCWTCCFDAHKAGVEAVDRQVDDCTCATTCKTACANTPMCTGNDVASGEEGAIPEACTSCAKQQCGGAYDRLCAANPECAAYERCVTSARCEEKSGGKVGAGSSGSSEEEGSSTSATDGGRGTK